MKKFKKILSLLMALAMVVTLLPAAAMAAKSDELVRGNVTVQQIENPGVNLKQDKTPATVEEIENPYSPEDIVRVIVVLEGKSLLEQGFTAAQISSNTDAVAKQVSNLKIQQNAMIENVKLVVAGLNLDAAAKTVNVRHTFDVSMNGFSLDVPYAALGEIAQLDGVLAAFLAPQYTIPEDQTDGTMTPSMVSTSGHFGSAQTWTDLGYTGEGMRIAIIDSGLDTDHPSFVDEPALVDSSLTVEEIAGVLENLHAYELYNQATGKTLTAEDLYISGKIPFGFNYIDYNLNVTHDYDNQGDHGTHVAGIAAANKIDTTDVVGVAPDAQVVVMKVFGANGGPYADDIVIALEDCFWLNMDAVNMSLGSPAGFSSSGYEWIDAVYDRIEESDMIVSISAGNESSSAYYNTWGTDTNLTSDPDIGLVGSPAVWGGTMVASMENTTFMIEYMTLGDRQIIYYDSTYYFAYLMAPEADTEYQYVMVPGVGTVDDFAQVDVAGKIAVVQRGEIDFTSKQENAYNAGAIACIVYNNVYTDEITYMMDGGLIPNIFIQRADGEAMAAAADENGVGTVTINAYGSVTPCENPYAGQMSSFSSWGGTPDLQLAPDVTAPGGNIYSCYTDGAYGMMSGTSMSAPHIAGMAALVLQHLHEKYPDMDEAAMHNLAEALIMSTATPVIEYNTGSADVPYSPRKQGSGNANVYDAITSSGYLTVDSDKPKVSLGDDDAKSGVYEFHFEINNLADTEMTYGLTADVLTDYVDLSYADYGLMFMGQTSLPLNADVQFSVRFATDSSYINYDADGDNDLDLNDVQYLLDCVNGVSGKTVSDSFDLNGDGVLNTADAYALYEIVMALPSETVDEVIVVPANGSVTVDVQVTLSDADKAYMEAYYPNGIYVEGFVHCYSMDDNCDLSLPFMGFYGDWSKAGEVFDSGWHWQTEDELWYERYINVLFTNYYGQSTYGVLGGNPYMAEAYDPSQNVLSPNGDGYQDLIDDIYLGMMRSADWLTFNWVQEDGTVLAGIDLEHVPKSYFNTSAGMVLPFVWSWNVVGNYDYTDENGNYLPSGTKLNLVIDAYLDDGDLVADDNITVPIIIDTEAPVIVEGSMDYLYGVNTDTRVLSFDVSDDYDIAALIPLTSVGDPYEYVAVNGNKSDDGETCTITLDVSGYDSSFILCVADYGLNENYYTITFSGETDTSTDKFYGYRQASIYDAGNNNLVLTDGYSGWHSFGSADNMTMHTSMYNNGETPVMAAEYIDGYIFGVDSEGEIFVMKAGDWTRISLSSMPTGYNDDYDTVPYPALDMAYDYTTGTLYILTDELTAGSGGHLMSLDYTDSFGYVNDLGIIAMPEGHAGQLLTLACDNDGVVYAMSYVGDVYAETYYEDTGDLYTIDTANPEVIVAENWWEEDVTYYHVSYVGETYYVPELYQSMTVDHATNKLYWAAYPGWYNSYNGAFFFELDKETGAVVDYTLMDSHSQMTALYKPYDSGVDIIPEAGLEVIMLNSDKLAMGVGTTASLSATPFPYNADLGEVVWTSSDPSVAVVFNGAVMALSEGTAVVTATSGDISAECVIEVVNLSANLTVFDMGSNYMWQSFSATAPADAAYLSDATAPYNGVTAAAYFNGSIYASEQAGSFYRLDAETMQGEAIGSPNLTMIAMAFNYADGYMYGIEQVQSMWSSANYVVRVNLNNGEVERIADFGNIYTPLGGMAIDYEGNFYSYCGNNETWGYELVQWTVEDGYVVPVMSWSMDELYSYNFTSMTYSAQDNGIYWMNDANDLYWIDMESLTEDNYVPRVVYTGTVPTEMGYFMSMAMFTVPETEPELPVVALDAVTVPASYAMLVGGSTSAGVSVAPWNAYPEISYAIADETVATVDASGTITGISAGETVLIVTVDGWDTVYEVPVTVTESTGYINGFLISDFMYGSNMFIDFSDLNPTNDYGVLSVMDSFNLFAGAYYNGKIYAFAQDNYGDYNYKNFFLTIDTETYDPSLSMNPQYTMGEKIHYTLRDMAVDYTTGNLYAIAEDGALAGAVALVDPETGAVTVVADTGKALAAMTIDAEGNMYAVGEDGNLYLVNKNTAELTLVGDLGVEVAAMYQSMHYDLNTGNTYWSHVAPDQTSSLRLIDLTTGTSSSLGSICPSGAMLSAMYTVPNAEPTEPDMETVKITGIEVTDKATVTVGETVELNATVLTAVELNPTAIQPMSVTNPSLVDGIDVTVTWTSADESVATVDESGVVTGVSAGTVLITATAGDFSASCVVTVTAAARKFYAYDKSNAQWISFTEGDGQFQVVESTDYYGNVSYNDVWSMNTTVEHADAEGETGIAASTYTGEVIYAYGADGTFFSVDPMTFERTALGNGIAGETFPVTVEGYDWMWDEYYSYEAECVPSIIDISYDCAADKLYAAVGLVNEDEGVEMYSICEVDPTDGSLSILFVSGEIKPANLYVENGVVYFVDSYMSGMLTVINLNDAEPAPAEIALTQGYWGNVDSSVSLIKDYLTGSVYAIRDMTDTSGSGYYDDDWNYHFTPWDGVTGAATLCTYNLSDADIVELGRIGNNIVVNSLFLR